MKHFASECGVCNTFGTFAIKMCGSLARNFVKKNIQRGSPFEPSSLFTYYLLTYSIWKIKILLYLRQ